MHGIELRDAMRAWVKTKTNLCRETCMVDWENLSITLHEKTLSMGG